MIPGLYTVVTLNRQGIASQDAMGTPVMEDDIIWTKKGHYQQVWHQDGLSPTGRSTKSMYKFWLPFFKDEYRPQVGDIITADGREYVVLEIAQESRRHHLLLHARIQE